VRGTQVRSRLLLIRVVFGVRGVGDAPGGQVESYVWSRYPHTRYEEQGHSTEI
jgi:hypothetical protein